MSAVDFRRPTAADLPGIVALLADDDLGRQREAPGLPTDPRYEAAFAALDRDPNQLLVVAAEEGALLGCLQLSFIPGLSHIGQWRGQIESERIASTRRGSGLGRRLLDWALQECRDRGCGLVQLTSDKSRPEALRFYESLGFAASHEGLKLRLM